MSKWRNFVKSGHNVQSLIQSRFRFIRAKLLAAKKETHEGSFFTPKDSIVFFFSVLNKNCLMLYRVNVMLYVTQWWPTASSTKLAPWPAGSFSGQSYKQLTIIIYDSRVLLTRNLSRVWLLSWKLWSESI